MIYKPPIRGTYKGTQILTSDDLNRWNRHISYDNIDMQSFNKPSQFFYESYVIIYINKNGDFKVLKNRYGYDNDLTILEDLKNNDIDGYNKFNTALYNIKNKLRKQKLDSL